MPAPIAIAVPLKGLARAKSRLALPDAERRALALEMGMRTVRAALRTPEVIAVAVVTADPLVAQAAVECGALLISEGRESGLARATRRGRAELAGLHPSAAIGILVGDLPSLESSDLSAAIAEFRESSGPMAVTDRDGTGTTLLLHPPGARFPMLFGPDSARRHAEAGYRLARGELTGLRHDLDTLADRAATAV